jgi:class 3 adenylate cyclase
VRPIRSPGGPGVRGPLWEGTLSGERVERRLAAILAADVTGYSHLMGQDEAGTLSRLRAHRRELIDPSISEHKGRVVKTTGDGILIEFPSVVEAVACAITVQRGMAERNAGTPEDQRIVFRVGVNLGDIIIAEDNDIHGDGVNVAARLEGIAEPGGICISGTVRDHIGGRLDVAFEDMGDQALKNIARPLRVYRVRHGPSAVRRRLPLQVAFGSLRSLALAAQLLHAGTYGRKIVSCAGSIHVCSSRPIGRPPLVCWRQLIRRQPMK